MRKPGFRAPAPSDSSVQILNLLTFRLWKAEPLAAGRFLLEQARQIREELQGQIPGLPNLSGCARRLEPDSILVWEALPELARRLMKQQGTVAFISREERQMVPCDHFSDADLRSWTGELLRPERFAAAAQLLRDHPEITPRRGLRPFAAEVFGAPFATGNAVEIASAKLAGVDLRRPPADSMSRTMAHLGESLAPGRGWRSWSPELQAARMAKGTQPIRLPLTLPDEWSLEPDEPAP